MATIKGIGSPTSKTEGAIGDIYIDERNGNTYKCVFSYCLSETGSCNCDWELQGKPKTTHIEIIEEKEIKAEMVDKSNDIGQNQSKHKDYTAYSKKNK